MKLSQRILLVAGIVALGTISMAQKATAQIWAEYDSQIATIFYNPLPLDPLSTLSESQFLNFTGQIDPDDGVYNNLPVGFTFDYDKRLYNSVNVCVNGWISVGPRETPVITQDNNYLFTQNRPNGTIAPFWGDHYYRTFEPGYRHSYIHYQIDSFPDLGGLTPPGSMLHVFTIEWKDLNIMDKNNPNSIASFQVKIIENPLANNTATPDRRPTIEFHYGSIGNTGTVVTEGATVGIEDSAGISHMNGLFPSSLNNEEDARTNTTAKTTCFPPATCLPGRVIQYVPEGRSILNQWGDGDVNLTQFFDQDPYVRTHQSTFVTIDDADTILKARAALITLDRAEGRAAFHGDANHNGRYTDPQFPGIFFYRVTSYDAAYILLYLAAKLPVLPWPEPLPVPAYKGGDANTAISGIFADGANATVSGNLVRVPVILRGTANGAVSVEMNVVASNGLTLSGATGANNMLMRTSASGRVVLAGGGKFADGTILGYLEFASNERSDATLALSDVTVNDEVMAGSSSDLHFAAAGVDGEAGYALEQNVPNPFVVGQTTATSIKFTLGRAESVSLRVFDMLGNEIRTLSSGEGMTSGAHALAWDGRDNTGSLVANGLYYYQLTTPSFTKLVKMQVIH